MLSHAFRQPSRDLSTDLTVSGNPGKTGERGQDRGDESRAERVMARRGKPLFSSLHVASDNL